MSVQLGDLIYEALNHRNTAIGYFLSRELARLNPQKALFEGNQHQAFNIEAYAEAGLCELEQQAVPHPERMTYWLGREQGQMSRPHNAHFRVEWEGNHMAVLIMHWPDQTGQFHYFILADTLEVADSSWARRETGRHTRSRRWSITSGSAACT